MGPVSPLRQTARLVSVSTFVVTAFIAGAQTPDFDFGDGRHGSITVPSGETTIQDLWSQVRTGSDAPAYDPAIDSQVPNLENLTISSGGTLTVTGYTGNAAGAVDPTAGGVLRLKVRGTLTIEAGAGISATGKGYRGGTMEGEAPGRIGQQGDSWGNGGGISGEANRGGGGGGFGEVADGDNPGSGGGGGHREAGVRGATGMGSETGGLGGASFDTVATDLGQSFRDTYPFPRFGSGGGRGGQTGNFTNTLALGGNGGGVIIIEARRIINGGAISADGSIGGSGLSGGGGGAGGSILIQTLSTLNGAVTVDGGAGGAGTVLGNDGGAGGAGIQLWDTRFELTTAVEGQGTVELSPGGGLYDQNAVVDVTAAPADGWTFDHWEGDLTGSLNPGSITMDSAKMVTAFFTELPSLVVTPLTRDIGPSGGNLSFNVTVSGSAGAIDWTSVVETGSEFISINTGANGTNDDVITLTVAQNTLDTARTGTIAVSSDDVAGDPVILTINQGPATPVLAVTPADATASAEGEELVIQVRNTGTGTFDWTATLLTGQAFATISSGGTGTNDGTFVVSLTENLSALQRTVTLSVSAAGALNSPANVTITQQAGVPLLQVTPSAQLIGSAAGAASLTVNNGGNGTMNWTASVVEGASYATITEGSNGTNAGNVTITFQSNVSMQNRIATVRVESVDAANSPVEVTITQTSQEAVLLVTPETQTVGSGAGTASYQVQNTGTGTMNWTAAVVTGANFVTVTAGASGTNDGSVMLSVAENTGIEDRTATIEIVAPGAANSPRTVTLVQTSRTPVLRIVPAEQSVGSNGGAVNITVENGGTGTLSWTASLAEGAEFLSITSASSGVNDGSIQVTVAPNAEGESRTGTIRFEAPGATDSPLTATIIQLGCAVLDRPENLAASDGVFSERVDLLWSSVPNAMEYEIFRAPLESPDRRELIGTTATPQFSDTLAEPPTYELVNRGCFNPGEFIITNVIYYYEVKAVNPCGASDFSARTTGYRGLSSGGGEVQEEPVFVEKNLLPAGLLEDGAAVAPYAPDQEGAGQFLAGLGDVFEVLPHRIYPTSQLIRIPAPEGADPESVTLYYYGENEDGAAWYAAEDVAGWLAEPIALSEDGLYLEAWVNHGGFVRAGRLPGEAVPVSGAVWPADYGTLLLLALTAGMLAVVGRRRRTA